MLRLVCRRSLTSQRADEGFRRALRRAQGNPSRADRLAADAQATTLKCVGQTAQIPRGTLRAPGT